MVGKGVTFDSGGLSIKPADRMEEMKMDKIGACTVISAMATIAQLDPGRPLLAVAPAVENMPGPHSTRPGDIIRALNGKWVEIQNTDAEGRLILADALTYAEQQGARGRSRAGSDEDHIPFMIGHGIFHIDLDYCKKIFLYSCIFSAKAFWSISSISTISILSASGTGG